MKSAERHSVVDTDIFSYMGRLCRDLSTDLYEESGMLVAKMALPGLLPEEIEIALEGDVLTVSGMREEETHVEEKEYYNKEIRRGSFYRSIRLPKMVDVAHTTAQYRDGMLTIQLPILRSIDRDGVKIPVSSKEYEP